MNIEPGHILVVDDYATNRLKQQVQQLRIEIDKAKQARQVTEITDTDYFRDLRRRANELRDIFQEEADKDE